MPKFKIALQIIVFCSVNWGALCWADFVCPTQEQRSLTWKSGAVNCPANYIVENNLPGNSYGQELNELGNKAIYGDQEAAIALYRHFNSLPVTSENQRQAYTWWAMAVSIGVDAATMPLNGGYPDPYLTSLNFTFGEISVIANTSCTSVNGNNWLPRCYEQFFSFVKYDAQNKPNKMIDTFLYIRYPDFRGQSNLMVVTEIKAYTTTSGDTWIVLYSNNLKPSGASPVRRDYFKNTEYMGSTADDGSALIQGYRPLTDAPSQDKELAQQDVEMKTYKMPLYPMASYTFPLPPGEDESSGQIRGGSPTMICAYSYEGSNLWPKVNPQDFFYPLSYGGFYPYMASTSFQAGPYKIELAASCFRSADHELPNCYSHYFHISEGEKEIDHFMTITKAYIGGNYTAWGHDLGLSSASLWYVDDEGWAKDRQGYWLFLGVGGTCTGRNANCWHNDIFHNLDYVGWEGGSPLLDERPQITEDDRKFLKDVELKETLPINHGCYWPLIPKPVLPDLITEP